MDFTRLIYNSFMNLKKNLDEINDDGIKSLLKGMDERLEAFDVKIIVHEDWIIKIENTLKYIENAIVENRQFIREDGEVLPIEKVRKVNKASIANLAKHSEYISKVPKEDDSIIPDKLYTIEKETDFSVYENKFLFLLLTTLRGFLSVIQEGISDAIESGYTTLSVKKKNKLNDLEDNINILLEGKNRGENSIPSELKDTIDRIENISSRIDSFLNMNLMKEMSKYPLISSNITKTNVLRMNENFKACVDLYEFITRYDELGYDVILNNRIIHLDESEKTEIEIALLTIETLAYKDSKELSKAFNKEYETYLRELDDSKREIRDKRISELKEKFNSNGKADYEYIILLEDKIADLLNLKEELIKLDNENKALKSDNERLNNVIVDKNTLISDLEKQIHDLLNKNNELNEKIIDFNKNELLLNDRISELEKESSGKDKYVEDSRVSVGKLNSEISRLQAELINKEAEKVQIRTDIQKDLDIKDEKISILQARLLTHGERSLDDYTSEKNFDELEREYKMIEKIYKEEWKKTKKAIKKKLKEGE